jgi:hypothetical protein
VLLGITGGKDLKMAEINDAAKLVSQTVDQNAKIIFGAYHDKNMKENQIKVTLIATGFSSGPYASSAPAPSLFAGSSPHDKSSHDNFYQQPSSSGSSVSRGASSAESATPRQSGVGGVSNSAAKESNEKHVLNSAATVVGYTGASVQRTESAKSARETTSSTSGDNASVAKFAPRGITGSSSLASSMSTKKEDDPDAFWDIPAFLRRRKK